MTQYHPTTPLSLALVAIAVAACGGTPTTTDGGNTGADGGTNPGIDGGTNPGTDGGTNPGTDSGTNPGTDSGTNPGTDSGTNPGTDSGTNPGSDGGGMTTGFACTTATLFAGNPRHGTPSARPAEGTALLADPPFPYRNVVFSNGQMITHNGQEIWRANLTDGILRKVAGTESTRQALVTGACRGARFGNIHGIALARDGSLFVSDQTGNAILKVTDPLGAGCTVSHYAGTPRDLPEDSFNPDRPPNVGNVDGPGATARFALPERMTVDGEDNLYVWDAGNNSIRKIASDSAHTVSTVTTRISVDGGGSLSLAYLNGKLYVWGKSTDTLNIRLAEVNPTNGMVLNVLNGRASLFGGSSSDGQSWGGIVTDGTGLIVHFNGQLWYVETNGRIRMPALAGVYRPGLEYPSGYDARASRPAAQVVIPEVRSGLATAGAAAWLAIDASRNLYVSARADSYYVLRLACRP
jgi:hypothetical protein